jgi:hypothetical protein
VTALFWTLFARSTFAQPATVVAGTTGEGAALATVRSLGVGSDSHCGAGHDNLSSDRSVGEDSASHSGCVHDT